MGGCRCTFRSCNVTTQKFPGMHFFHYPMRDEERLEKWISYANYASIHQLSKAQQRNKVVCALHFRDECFMNYKKDRLTPTAIPTLVRLRNGLAFDYSQSKTPKPMALEPPTGKHLIPPKGYVPLGITEDFFMDETTNVEILEEEEEEETFEPLAKRAKISKIVTAEKKILNRIRLVSTPSMNNVDDEQTISLMNEVFGDEEYGIVLTDSVKSRQSNQIVLPSVSVVESDELINLTEIELQSVEKEDMEEQEEHVVDHVDLVEQEDVEDENVVSKAMYNETLEAFEREMIELKQECDKKERDAEAKLAQLEEELATVKIKAQVAAAKAELAESAAKDLQQQLEKAEAANEELAKSFAQTKTAVPASARLTKPQLFTGMRKYLSASMAALVRMEMFGGTERQWKPDEKQVSVELLRLGEGVYKYFSDEWRFRLPPKKMVEKWANEEAEEDEDYM